MEEPINEQKERDYSLEVARISTDPLHAKSIVFKAISNLGYSIEYKNPRVDEETGITYIDVYTTSEEQWRDIKNLNYLISVSGIGTFIHSVSDGNPHLFGKLFKDGIEEYYKFTPQSMDGMYPDGRFHADDQLLKRLYVAAYDRYFQLDREGRMYLKVDPNRGYGLFTATPDKSDTELYNTFIAQGVNPITSEELIELAKGEGEKIKSEGIDKRRSLIGFRRQRPNSDEISKT